MRWQTLKLSLGGYLPAVSSAVAALSRSEWSRIMGSSER